jgi:hypothetical protein
VSLKLISLKLVVFCLKGSYYGVTSIFFIGLSDYYYFIHQLAKWCGSDHMFKILIRVGTLAIIWSLWLYINNKLFTDKNCSPLQVMYRCTALLHSWSSL